MPRARRKLKARQSLTTSEINLMLTGVSLTTRFGAIHKGIGDMTGLREAWNDSRDELLPQWIEQHPFTRPWMWYTTDADQPRKLAEGEQRIDALEFEADKNNRHNYRLKDGFDWLNRRLGHPGPYSSEGVWETEKQYLCRCGLLTDWEKSLL